MTAISDNQSFIDYRQGLINGTNDPVLKNHFQVEINLVNSWGGVGGGNSWAPPIVSNDYAPPPFQTKPIAAPVDAPPAKPFTPPSGGFSNVPHGYAADWHTVRFSNTTGEAITIHVTVGAGDPLPRGVDAKGDVTIQPGKHVDLTFPPESRPNFKSTKGDGAVWNQGELYFDEKNRVIWGNMSYIYGANSNMRIFSQDGQHSGYLGNLFDNVPAAAKVVDWGIVAPYDRFHHSDDPTNPGSATGGLNGAKNAGAEYLYDKLGKGEGYVGRGRPAEVTDYDDASSLRFTGNVVVVL